MSTGGERKAAKSLRGGAPRADEGCLQSALITPHGDHYLRSLTEKLSKGEYDETTWAARTWLGFVGQRLSVAAQLAMAEEIAQALGLAAVGDPRGRE